MDEQPVGEFPPLGPRFAYWCAACAERWRAYGSPSGCGRHWGVMLDGRRSTTATVTFTDVAPAAVAAVFGEAWRNPVPDHNYPHL